MSSVRLIIDSSSLSGSICLARIGSDGNIETIIASKFSADAGTHSTWLLSSIKELLESNHLTPGQIDSFGLTTGPGSFTGLRIAVNAIKGLAFGRNDDCVYGVSVLESLAMNVKEEGLLVCPITDARRLELYSALYRVVGKDSVETIVEDHIVNSHDLLANLLKYKEKIIFVGTGADLIKDHIETLDNILFDYEFGDAAQNIVRSENIAALTTTLNCLKTTPSELKPAYIRRAEDVFKKLSNK